MIDLNFHLSASAPDNATILTANTVINNYWIGSLPSSDDKNAVMAIAVNGGDFEPEVLNTPTGLTFIGVEQGLFCVQPKSGSILTEIADLTFLQDIELMPDGQVLVSAEDEVLMFNAVGELAWRTSLPDIIESADFTADGLEIDLSDGQMLLLSLKTGRSVYEG